MQLTQPIRRAVQVHPNRTATMQGNRRHTWAEFAQRVASLAAEGRSNKEIASALFVSVHTVEAHLSRVYRKLDIRSRGQLGRRIAAFEDANADDATKV